MSISALLPVFLTVFVAELGDKTQLATMLFTTNGERHPLLVFAAASLALCLSTAIAVLLGHFGAKYLAHVPLNLIAGIGFMAIGAWTLLEHFNG